MANFFFTARNDPHTKRYIEFVQQRLKEPNFIKNPFTSNSKISIVTEAKEGTYYHASLTPIYPNIPAWLLAFCILDYILIAIDILPAFFIYIGIAFNCIGLIGSLLWSPRGQYYLLYIGMWRQTGSAPVKYGLRYPLNGIFPHSHRKKRIQ